MATVRRLFGFKDDPTAGGSSYDALSGNTPAFSIPDADTFWPVTNVTFDRGITQINRNTEVRQRRASSPPLPWTARPVVTVQVPAYGSVVAKAARKTLGAADSVSGTPPVSVDHTFGALPFGSSYPPAVHASVVRDDLYHKIAGCVFERMSLNFPLDGEGTMEAELHGLYYYDANPSGPGSTTPPTAVFTGLSTSVLALRDAEIFIDGSGTAIPDLQGFTFQWVNNTIPKPYAKRNVVAQTIGTPSLVRRMWYYHENKLGAAQDVTFTLNLGNTNVAQELAADFTQIQKFVFDVQADPLGSTPPANEMIRITIYNGAWTGGGADALTARDDITSSFTGGAFFSTADSNDVLFEYINSTITPIT